MQPIPLTKGLDYKQYLELTLRERWPTHSKPLDWTPAGEPLLAEIGGSNWRVRCDTCTEIIIYEPGEPFICPQCLNATNGYKARPVEMPADRKEIERILLERPVPETRDWSPTETAAQLRAENTFRTRALGAGLKERDALRIMDMYAGDVELAEIQLDAEIKARQELALGAEK